MTNNSSISGIQGLLAIPLSLLLLSATVFSSSVFGHAGIQEEIKEITRLIRQDPANAQLYLQRGDLYRIHQDWDHAREDFHKALQAGTDDASAETGLGRTCFDQGLHQQALAHLNRALALQPGNVRALVTRAKTWRVLGKPLATAADYTRAIRQFQSPREPLPEYYLQRARAYAAAGDPHIGQALQGLDEGMQVLGNIQTLALYAVELETQRGNVEAALERLDTILAGSPRRESLLLQRGDILLAANRNAEAQQEFLAAQAAIAALPLQRRHTRSMQQLAAALTGRLQSAAQQDDHAQ
ncbi:MAG: tetratricopeptide repeat protein [Pseudomonadota bacterium]